jgi:hypothetical protein
MTEPHRFDRRLWQVRGGAFADCWTSDVVDHLPCREVQQARSRSATRLRPGRADEASRCSLHWASAPDGPSRTACGRLSSSRLPRKGPHRPTLVI